MILPVTSAAISPSARRIFTCTTPTSFRLKNDLNGLWKRTKRHHGGPWPHSKLPICRAAIHPYVSDSSILALTFSNPLSESASSFVSTSKPLGRGHWDKNTETPRQIIWWLSRIHLHYAAVMKEGQSALVVSFCKRFSDRPSGGQWQDKDKPWIERTDSSESSEMSLSLSLFGVSYSTIVQLWTRPVLIQ